VPLLCRQLRRRSSSNRRAGCHVLRTEFLLATNGELPVSERTPAIDAATKREADHDESRQTDRRIIRAVDRHRRLSPLALGFAALLSACSSSPQELAPERSEQALFNECEVNWQYNLAFASLYEAAVIYLKSTNWTMGYCNSQVDADGVDLDEPFKSVVNKSKDFGHCVCNDALQGRTGPTCQATPTNENSIDPDRAQVDSVVASTGVWSRNVLLHFSSPDGMAWASIESASLADEVWLDRSLDDGQTWDPKVGDTCDPDNHQGWRTQMYSSKGGWLRACGKAGNQPDIACTSWQKLSLPLPPVCRSAGRRPSRDVRAGLASPWNDGGLTSIARWDSTGSAFVPQTWAVRQGWTSSGGT
jgi:hypothetical protein